MKNEWVCPLDAKTKNEVEMLYELIDAMLEHDSKCSLAKYELLVRNAMTTGVALLVNKLSNEQHQQLMNYAHWGEIFSTDEDYDCSYDVNKHLVDLFAEK